MKTQRHRHIQACLCVIVVFLCSCTREPEQPLDRPRLIPGVDLRDVTFHSAALDRDMQYRVLLPAKIPSGQSLPVVYLLHGGGGGFGDWSNYSDVSRFGTGLILVMPEGNSSYYVNSATRPGDRYEDYIVNDLISDVESKFPAERIRSGRAVVGVSMGGFGAVELALTHPNLFSFAAGLSPAIDVPSRPFSVKRISQWRQHRSIFGPWGSEARHGRDPFVLARSANPAQVPYLYLSCGEQEGLMPANRRFAELLASRHFQYEFHSSPGGHDWNQWNQRLGSVFQGRIDHSH
jgi:putative tributyrin esterase